MKKAIAILSVLAVVAFAGEVVTGGSEMLKFKGYGTFRWDMNGMEDANPGNDMSTYSYISWMPKLNDYVDGYIAVKMMTPSPSFNIDCAYLNLHFTENFTLTAGQFKKPFGYAFTRSGGSMYFADRSGILYTSEATEMLPALGFDMFGGYDNSAMLTAEFAPVTVDLALSNGTGTAAAFDDVRKKQFTARLVAEPTEWLELGGAMAMVGLGDDDETEEVDESWGATGMDFYGVVNYPVSPTGELVFVGEYMMWNAPDIYEDAEAGNGMSVMLGYDMDLEGDVFMGIMPAVRYDMVTPVDAMGGAEDTGMNNIDFCLNIDLFSEMNTLQLGMRNYGAEAEGFEGYTDMYAKWRMNF